MSWATAFEGEYDAAAQHLIHRYIEPNTLVVDVGAALGLWAVPLGRFARPIGASVWAVEPHPNNQRWLRYNIGINGLGETVTVLQCALGSEEGTARMEAPEHGRGDAAGSTAINLDGSHPLGSVDVPIQRLDDLVRPARVSFMKLDVEGFELQVLSGAGQLIREDRPVIFGEFNRTWLDLRGEDLNGYLKTMQDIGYSVFSARGSRSRPWRPIDAHDIHPAIPHSHEEDLLLVPST